MKRGMTMVAAGVMIGAAGLLVAGPLSPPAGPVASTYKTLSEVEPRIAVNAVNTPGDAQCVYRISQPGSYYLTGNVTGAPGKTTVRISSGGVSLDLAGFTIIGGDKGVFVPATVTGVRVRNGAVTGAQTGIDLYSVNGGRVQQVDVYGSPDTGISVGQGITVAGCSATQCGTGFSGTGQSKFEDCAAETCTTAGFYCDANAVVLTRCTAADGTGTGFLMATSSACVLESCVAMGNGVGFSVGYGSRVTGCTAVANSSDGVLMGMSCTVEGTHAMQNQGVGITVGEGSVVRGCIAEGNGEQGVKTFGDFCSVSGNQVGNNGPGLAGVWIHSNGCRVEDNRTWAGGFGVYVDGTDNIIVRNSCRGATNTAYSVAAGNEMAPVVVNPGLNGFSTATAWSNLAY